MNLFLTMFIGGLWHGSNWTFLIWGSIHGGALVLERFLVSFFGNPEHPVARAARWVVTFHVVTLAWVFFNARNASTAFEILGRIARLLWLDTGPSSQYFSILLVVVIVAVVAVQFVPNHTAPTIVARFSELHPLVQGAIVGVAMIVCYRFGSVDDFIYFQF